MSTLETPDRSTRPTCGVWKRPVTPAGLAARARAIRNKYFMVSADCHANEPLRPLGRAHRREVPRRACRGSSPTPTACSGACRRATGRTACASTTSRARTCCASRPAPIRSSACSTRTADGIDAEIIYPNKGLSMWATPDAIFAQAQCRVFNEWAWETVRRLQRPALARRRHRHRRSRRLDRGSAARRPRSASARSRCRASRSGARTTSTTRTTTCPSSTRSGP